MPDEQLYVCICLPYCGPDLEAVKLSSWTEAASVFYQVVRSIAAAEHLHRFEVRELIP